MKMQKFLAALLALVMVLTLLPVTAFAAEGDEGESTDTGLELSKNAVLQADGTYTITLEGYATGTTTTSTVTKDVPLDIILVLDQSGSMAFDFNGNETGTNTDRRQYAMKQAVLAFISEVANKYDAETSDHRMAIVTFGSDASTLQGWTSVNADGKTTLDGKVNGLPDSPSGATNVGAGMTQAQSLHNDGSYSGKNTERQKVVIVFTDGVPTTSSDFSVTVANTAISAAKDMKDDGVTIYSIGIFGGANPSELHGDRWDVLNVPGVNDKVCNGNVGECWGLSGIKNIVNNLGNDFNDIDVPAANRFLNFVSSNFTGASELGLSYSSNGDPFNSVLVSNGPTWTITANADRTSSNHYFTASDAASLTNVFTQISENLNTSSTSVTLDQDAVMKDILSDEFKLPAGYSADSSITVKTIAGTANDAGEITWGAETETAQGVTATANVETGTIDVTGFNYAEKFISSGHPGEKLVVVISGVHPTSDAFTGTPIYTNDEMSGIYEDDKQDTPFQSFDSPTTTLHSKSYVLDYAKPVTVNASDWDQAKIYALMASAGAVTGESNAAAGTYGDATSTATTITYSPKTMEWKGYDSFYSFDNTEGAFSWAKINFIPANNVYYEDDFITTSTDGTTATGTVGFVYGSGWTVETTDETGNGESADTSVHGGWQNADLADDTGFSDGSAHKVTSKAKASFTFTGTGVDVYTRTNASSGGIRATLYKWNEETSSWDTLMIQYMNNLAESGDYYQIPTLSLHSVTGTDLAGNSVNEPLTYGKYKVDLIAYVIDGNATYYLDGIRIYNPAQEAENDTEDTTVGDAYEEDNALQAVFTEVRDILIDNGNFNAGDETVKGAVFIDSIDVTDEETQTSVTTQEIGTYVDYGPKNEVYLAKDQMIAIAVNETEGAHYFVGLKAPAGATTAKITNGRDTSELSIGHSTDLYYEVVPNADGLIIIENTTDNLLSVTKLQTTGTGSSDVVSVNTVMLMSYANEFDSLPVVAYSLRAPKPEVEEPEVTEPEATEPEATEPDVTEPEETEPETPDLEIEIENPEPAPEQKPEEKPNTGIRDLVKKIFGFLSKWF